MLPYLDNQFFSLSYPNFFSWIMTNGRLIWCEIKIKKVEKQKKKKEYICTVI